MSERLYLLDTNVLLLLVDGLVTIDINRPAVIDAYVELELVSLSQPGGARNMGKNDVWIAACARAAEVTLLTTDEDFGHLRPDHLDVEIIAPSTL